MHKIVTPLMFGKLGGGGGGGVDLQLHGFGSQRKERESRFSTNRKIKIKK